MSIKKLTMAAFVLIVIMSMLFTACKSDGHLTNDEPTQTPTEKQSDTNSNLDNSKEDDKNNNTECKHTQTKTVGQKDATCSAAGYTGDEVCEACNATVKKGTEIARTAHTYDSGSITKPATEVSTGVMTYTCTGCSQTTTEEIPLVEVSYKSFGDFIEAIIEEFVEIENGRIVFDTNTESEVQRLELTFNTKDGDRVAMLKLFSVTGEERTVYYRNGAFAIDKGDGNYEVMKIEDLMEINFEDFINNMKDSFVETDAAAKELFDQLADIEGTLGKEVVDEVNKILAEIGSEYTFDSLIKASKDIQGIYVYYCRKLGLNTSVEFPEGAPMGVNISKLLECFMSAEKTEDGTCYTCDFDGYMNAADAVISWLEEKQNTTYAELLFEMCGPTITQFYPEITDWNKLLDHVRTKYNGNVKVGTFIDAVITVVEESGEYTVEQVYAYIEALILEATGQSVNLEEIVAMLSEATLDDMAAAICGEGMDMSGLYDMINDFMTTTTIGDTVVDGHYEEEEIDGEIEEVYIEVTLSEVIKSVRETFDANRAEGGISITVNENGKIVGLEYTQKTGKSPEDDTFEYTTSLVIESDGDVTVQLPENLNELGQE